MFLTKAALVLLLYASRGLCDTVKTVMFHGEEIISDCLEFADVALVVDVSGSIEGNGKYPGRFNKYIKWFLKTFVKGLHVASGRVQVGMVTFGNSGHLEFGLTSDLDKVIGKIELYDYKGQSNTNTSGGIEVMRTQLLSSKDPNYRPNSAHIAVVVTDGASNLDKDKTITSAKNARNDKIILLGIGVTKEVNLDELTGIATPLIAFDKTSLEKGIKTGAIALSGTVAYVPEIEGLNYGVVDQLVTHFKKTVCTTKCPFGDKATWCASLLMTTCPDPTIKAICCETCHWAPDTKPKRQNK